MSKSIRIRTTPNGNKDTYLKVKLNQDFDFIEILSLKISQAEVYSRFCSDYGVVVGRVIINDGLGVPNAKVSIFVPLMEDDEDDSDIAGLYPYKDLASDKNNDGLRYNLLQKDANPQETCFTPVGSFPSKREVIDNDTSLEIYEKYYKFTTTTNDAGDFMLFGVPTGSHVLNVDADLSDIGLASQRPYDYIAQGESKKSFNSPTKFKSDKDLDKLIQIKNIKKGVNVQPFWGDGEQCDIGITRVDIDLKKRVTPAAIFMGSIFTDSDKNSVNKQCRPRKDLGKICETVTTEGSVEMIRKTMDGSIERFDVEGGRVITSDGSWAYQIPMNLDFVTTDEFGNLTPSEDPNKGIATKARVRFRIGMDVTGGNGRLRTSAKYLVPHNPPNRDWIDYNFDENTSDEHFRDLYWNKIYSVSNFIPRVQGVCSGGDCADNRNFTGIKDVDDCTGVKNPFPYNRVDTDFNPIFSIICIIMKIITMIIFLVNSTIVTLINFIIWVLNIILKKICTVVFSLSKTIAKILDKIPIIGDDAAIKIRTAGCIGNCNNDDCDNCECDSILGYVSCIMLECDGGNGPEQYSPGCNCEPTNIDKAKIFPDAKDIGSTSKVSLGCWAAYTKSDGTSPSPDLDHWNTFSSACHEPDHTFSPFNPSAGYVDCQAIKLAEKLNMFELDFYNDWINGTLYAYSVKYKEKKSGKQKFCDAECYDPESDNNCDRSWYVDSGIDGDGNNNNPYSSVKNTVKVPMHEGFIKQVTTKLPNGHKSTTLYYSPFTNLSPNLKLFATELIHLGSVFECDWQGIPKIQEFLTTTSYKRPAYVSEYVSGGNDKISCGMTSTGTNGVSGVFFDVDCLGISIGSLDAVGGDPQYPRSTNIKRICEMGVDIDQAEFNSVGGIVIPSNCRIMEEEIDNPLGRLFRDTFYQLNIGDGNTSSYKNKISSWVPLDSTEMPNTGFAVGGVNNGGYVSTNLGPEYITFRGASSPTSYVTSFAKPSINAYTQPDNSFFFYFGTELGRSGLDIMNTKYFTTCEPILKKDFAINGVVVDASTSNDDGEINITVIPNDAGPYTYNWSNGATTEDLTGLPSGTYTVNISNALGGTSNATFVVGQPAAFFCDTSVVQPSSPAANGEIIINGVGGGDAPYFYSLNGGSLVPIINAYANIPVLESTTPYILVVSDSSNNTCTNSLLITAPPLLTINSNNITKVDNTCGEPNGSITIGNINTMGGTPPYSFSIIEPTVPYNGTTLINGNLLSGNYTITVTDASTTAQTATTMVTIPPTYPVEIELVPDQFCWIDGNDPVIIPRIRITAKGSWTLNWTQTTIPNSGSISGNHGTLQTVEYNLGSGFNLSETNFTLVGVGGCSYDLTADYTAGGYSGVPLTPFDVLINMTLQPVHECRDGNNDVCRPASIGKVQVYPSGGWDTSYTVVKWQRKDGNNTPIDNLGTNLILSLSGGNGNPSLDRSWRALVEDAIGCQKWSPWQNVAGSICPCS